MLNVTKAKYDGVKYAVILSLFLFSIGHAQSISKDRALRWSPYISNPQTESFSAIYYEWNDASDKWKKVDTLALVCIDSNGNFFPIHSLDPSLRMQSFTVLNDTLLLSECCGDYGKTTISVYNVLTHSIKKLLDKSIITAVSSDHQYFACQRDNISSPSTIYQVKKGEILEKIKTPYHIHSAFGKNGFIAEDRFFDYSIMRNDGNISDTIPKEFGNGYLEHGKNDRELINIPPRMTVYRGNPNPVISYNLDTKKKDTIFSDRIFFTAIALPNTDYYLLNGLFEQEWKDQLKAQMEAFKREHPNGGAIDDLNTPTGYWMIGNSKTKKIKKLDYKDLYPIPSASGRHILFYKQDDNDFQTKVVSVKELIDGL